MSTAIVLLTISVMLAMLVIDRLVRERHRTLRAGVGPDARPEHLA